MALRQILCQFQPFDNPHSGGHSRPSGTRWLDSLRDSGFQRRAEREEGMHSLSSIRHSHPEGKIHLENTRRRRLWACMLIGRRSDVGHAASEGGFFLLPTSSFLSVAIEDDVNKAVSGIHQGHGTDVSMQLPALIS